MIFCSVFVVFLSSPIVYYGENKTFKTIFILKSERLFELFSLGAGQIMLTLSGEKRRWSRILSLI